MTKELSSFYFPYFLIPDEQLKLGLLYFDKIYVDALSDEQVSATLENIPKEGSLVKYVLGQIRAIGKALEAYETQQAAWRASGLLSSGIIVPSTCGNRLEDLPTELREKLYEGKAGLICALPKETATWLMKNKLKVWQMQGTYNFIEEDANDWRALASTIRSWDERMPIDIEEEFENGDVPKKAFQYRAQPKVEGSNAVKAALLKSLQNYGPYNCHIPAYLPLLLKGITPWVADSTTEKLLTHQLQRSNTLPLRSTNSNITSAPAVKALRFALPSLSFRSFEEVLEARYLCRDSLSGYRDYVMQLVRQLETQDDVTSDEEIPQILIQRLEAELTDLKAQINSTNQAFLRDAAKRAAPLLTTLGIQLYMNTPLIGVVGAALGTAIAALISAHEAQIAHKKLLYGKRAHGLSFMIRLQRILK